MHFQQFVASKLSVDPSRCGVEFVEFPPNIPISEIVEQEDVEITEHKKMKRAKNMAVRLYMKYVAVGSEYEINISSAERMALTNNVGNVDVLLSMDVEAEQLFLLFEHCKTEMMGLMEQQFSHFRYSPDFAQIRAIFAEH